MIDEVINETVRREFESVNLQTLSKLYLLLCDCRIHYPELEGLLNPAFHTEECLYRIKIEPLEIEFTDE